MAPTGIQRRLLTILKLVREQVHQPYEAHWYFLLLSPTWWDVMFFSWIWALPCLHSEAFQFYLEPILKLCPFQINVLLCIWGLVWHFSLTPLESYYSNGNWLALAPFLWKQDWFIEAMQLSLTPLGLGYFIRVELSSLHLALLGPHCSLELISMRSTADWITRAVWAA